MVLGAKNTFFLDSHAPDDYRQRFDELIAKYPNGQQPEKTDWYLLIPYKSIKEYGCCGIDSIDELQDKHSAYFHQNFRQNCVIAEVSAKYSGDLLE